jgi:hypothetical protein
VHCKLQTSFLVREDALERRIKLLSVEKKKSKIKSGQGSQREARYPDELVDWLLAARRTPTPTPSVEGEMSTPRYMQAGVPQGSVLSPTLYTLFINDAPQTPGVNLALFADDTCLYATDHKEDYVLRKIQRGLDPMAA